MSKKTRTDSIARAILSELKNQVYCLDIYDLQKYEFESLEMFSRGLAVKVLESIENDAKHWKAHINNL